MERTMVSISRQWNKPEIEMWINDNEHGLQMSLEEFMVALESEIGSVTTVFTQKTFHDRITAAKDSVLKKIKHEMLHKIVR